MGLHPQAQFKLYKLAVARSEFNKLFDENLWPKGVFVRTYRSQNARIKVVFLLDFNFFFFFFSQGTSCLYVHYAVLYSRNVNKERYK